MSNDQTAKICPSCKKGRLKYMFTYLRADFYRCIGCGIGVSHVGSKEPQYYTIAKELVSNCCGASPVQMGDRTSADAGVCSKCKEHCEYTDLSLTTITKPEEVKRAKRPRIKRPLRTTS